jgi:hypothetical protein
MSKWLYKAIFDIYTSISFQCHEERLKAKCFDPCNWTLKFWESRRIPKSPFRECECHPHTLPKVGLWHATYPWKYFDNGYNFAWDLTSIRGLHKKLWPSKVSRVPISGLPRQNDIWMQPLWLIKKNIKRGRWWLPLSSNHGESCKSMYAHCSSMYKKCSNFALTNLFGLCRSVWIIDSLVTCLSPYLGAPTHPSTTEVLQIKERTLFISSFVVFIFEFAFESFKECGGAS